jgi:hypothetical protein
MVTKIYSLKQFSDFDSAYWSMGCSSDGKIYFALSSHLPDKSAGLFSFDPAAERIEHILNLSDVLPSLGQGKVHTPIFEGLKQRLYFGSHFAYPYGIPRNEIDYEGGHLLAYDPRQAQVIDFGIAYPHEGIMAMEVDAIHGRAYLLTSPSGYLIQFDMGTDTFHQLGKIPPNSSICRTLAVDKRGVLYGSYEDDGLFMYNPGDKKLTLKPSFFPHEQVEEWQGASRRGVGRIGRSLWRCITYDYARDILFGIFSSTSRSFSIDCQTLDLDMHSPMLPTSYSSAEDIYPTLSLVANTDNLFYVPANGMFDYCRSEKISSPSHIMSLDKQTGQKHDMGVLADGARKVYGVAGAAIRDNYVYLLGATVADINSSSKVPPSGLSILQGMPFELSLTRVRL